MKRAISILFIALVASLAYVYRDYADDIVRTLAQRYAPCRTVINYSIGAFDTRFGLSQEDFLMALQEGEKVWEDASGLDLFRYREDGELAVSLVYDERQETTDRLGRLGIAIQSTKSAYEEVKTKYNELYAAYQSSKIEFDRLLAKYEQRRKAYEANVAYWNGRGGAPRGEYEKLTAEREGLRTDLLELKRSESRTDELAADVNALVEALNRLAEDLNLNARRYNTIGASQSEEFEEGSYQSGPSGSSITIYQFENREKLIRVIAHEMGHALGIGHLDDPTAIMYRLNQGETGTPAKADIEALNARCSLRGRK